MMTVMAILYIVIGGSLLISAAFVKLSQVFGDRPYSLEPTAAGRKIMEEANESARPQAT